MLFELALIWIWFTFCNRVHLLYSAASPLSPVGWTSLRLDQVGFDGADDSSTKPGAAFEEIRAPGSITFCAKQGPIWKRRRSWPKRGSRDQCEGPPNPSGSSSLSLSRFLSRSAFLGRIAEHWTRREELALFEFSTA